jgi:hypothetical protein
MNALKVKLAKFNAMDRWYSPKKLKRHQNEGEKKYIFPSFPPRIS